MKPEELLGVIVRAFGLLIVAYALYGELFALLESVGFIPNAREPASRHGLFGALYLLIALMIVKMADPIARLTYGRARHRAP